MADSTAARLFEIPAGTLAEALTTFGRQAEVRIVVDARTIGAAQSQGVTGRHTPAEALRLLLEGSGFVGRFTDASTVAVAIAGGTPSDDSAQALRRVVVTGSTTRQRGYGASRSSTATRTDTPLRDVPQSATVVTRELIDDQSMQGMADVVRYVPGIVMGQGEGHRDAPTIRGNASTADFFVDGVRDDAQYYRDLYNVERVEALKGSNAMVFGRGGGGGILNRVTKDAGWAPVRSLALEGGAFEHRRAALDVGQGMGARVAARLNGMLERSNSFRDAVDVRRYGLNPTLTLLTGARTTLRLGYEHFDDARVVDRGIPSFEGRPSVTDVSTFFGDPSASHARARVQSAGATVEHETTRGLTIRNRTRFVHYDKFYQNVLPGAVNAAGTRVSLSAYNNGTRRANLFNQTDLTYVLDAGRTRHTLLAGMELGNQLTDNVRNTGYFAGSATSLSVPFDQPTVASGVTFAPSATDANNHVRATVGALYAQDQVELSRHWQAIAGVRADRFEIAYQNNRDGQSLRRVDHLVSPRAGLVFKPVVPLSIYSAYSISYLPSAGDQFSSLTATSKTLEPERFTNQEIGAKWDVRPSLSLTGAFYRLDRTNTSAKDPNDVTRTVQTGRQRTTGFELGASGNVTRSWQLAGGFASQRAVITSATAAARAGATVPLVPRQTISLWNRYQPMRAAGVGLGLIHQGRSYAAIDNSVVLPEFTRVDGALFFELNAHVRAQANVENLLDARYYPTSQGNNNILPGAPRLLRVALTTGF